MIRHFVTDRRRFGLSVPDLVDRVSRAATRGAGVIQVRERDLSDVDLLQLVRDIRGVASAAGARVIVNDRVDVAIASGAAGVHLPADSVAASRVRAIAAPGFLIGRSVHCADEIDRAIADGGCDYLFFGTVFPSHGKPPGHPVAGLDALRAACARSTLPVIAIGGMTESRAGEVDAAGAAGLAAIGMFM